MGQRHMFNTPLNIETGIDQEWDTTEQPYIPTAMSGAYASSSLVNPVGNTTIQSGQFSSQWNLASRSSGPSSSTHSFELPNYHPLAPGPSRDPFLYPSASQMLQDNCYRYQSSSSFVGHTVTGQDGGFYDQTRDSSMRTQKRKSPGIPPISERGSTSRYYDVGSSSNLHLPADPWQEKQNTESSYTPLEFPPRYRSNHLSIGNEGTQRNVRSRIDSETRLDRSLSGQYSDRCNSVDIWGQSSTAATRGLNGGLISPPGHRVPSGSDASFFSRDLNFQYRQNCRPSGSLRIGGYHIDHTSNRIPFPQNVNNNINQSLRGVQIVNGQTSVPPLGASSSNFRPGHMVSSDEGVHMVAESYPFRHPRPLPLMRWRSVNRNPRNLVSSDRHSSFTDVAGFRDPLPPQGLTFVDHSSASYGTGTLLDPHRDLRLDVDDMSYEELLALEERIGNVNTGLSDSLISKCLNESRYYSRDLLQDKGEGKCVICLEEYKNLDNVGTLKVCGHGFHVSCIQKWLSIKSLCPICKSSAMEEGKKDE